MYTCGCAVLCVSAMWFIRIEFDWRRLVMYCVKSMAAKDDEEKRKKNV